MSEIAHWNLMGGPGKESLLTVELKQVGEECEITLTHERFPRLEALRGHEKGWTDILGKLATQAEHRSVSRA